MKAAELYTLLRSSGYEVFPKTNGRLGIRGPCPLPTDIMEQVRRLKPELLQLVAVSDAGVELYRWNRASQRASGHTEPRISSGFPPVPIGWEPAQWVGRLRYLADRCESLVPDRAEWLRHWAREVEQQR